ncbi:MAG: hypothetical protein NWF06_03330 [Candidatus Bathyarchaeota archaeon]|nr:hypothetical protein [Candidatus Bathyarchaeum sp.]
MKLRHTVKLLMKSQFLLLFLIVSMVLSANVSIIRAEPITEKYEIIASLNEPTLDSPISIFNLNFSVEYEMTAIICSSQLTNLTLVQGYLAHYTDSQPTDVWIKDNLGNEYFPIIDETKIETPEINNITLFPNFEYRVTLHFVVVGAEFDNEINHFVWHYNLNTLSNPMSVTFKLPKAYEFFEWLNGTVNDSDNRQTTFHWNFTEGEPVNCLVIFVPFSLDRTITSIEITADIPIYSDDTSLEETIKLIYNLPVEIMIWNVTINIPVKISFPLYSTPVKVKSVFDGEGECEEIEGKLSEYTLMDNEFLGQYYEDDVNRCVWVFPRQSHQNELAKLEVEVTFIVPNIAVKGEYEIEPWEPYRGYTGLLFNFSEIDFWKIDLTGNFEVKFILPPDVEIITSNPNENIIRDAEENRKTLSFVYNSPTKIPEHEWLIVFDNLPLRTFTTNQIINIIVLSVYAVFLFGINKFFNINLTVAIVEILPVTALTIRIVDDLNKFFNLSHHNLFFSICMVLEVALLLLIIFLLIRMLTNQKNGFLSKHISQTEQNDDERAHKDHKRRYPRDPFSRLSNLKKE